MTRCIYCGHRCYGRTCRYHRDLLDLDPHGADALVSEAVTAPTMRDELRSALSTTEGKATR